LLGVIQATEVIKLILGKGEPLIGRLLLVNSLDMKFRELKLRKNPDCPVCGKNPTVTELIDYQQFCGIAPEPKAELVNERPVQNGIPQITPKELKQKLDSGENIFVLDVREPHEYQIANLGAKLIPLNDLPARAGELDKNAEIVVHCKSGGRSQKASEFLAQNGFKNVQNLAGGITAWSNDVDPTIAKY
jgi:adenylyltransferase/sulfurtransferase